MGIKMKSYPVFSVQYHPEAGPGPNDSKYLFEKFIEEIKLCQETTLLAQY
jgi:carbamoyl-phosphate synthase small subunit